MGSSKGWSAEDILFEQTRHHFFCYEPRWYDTSSPHLISGTNVAVTSKTGITIFSLKDGSRRELKGVKVKPAMSVFDGRMLVL